MNDKQMIINLTPPLSTLLTILFIGLKLTGFITWSWIWVLSPIWLPFAVALSIFSILFILALLLIILDEFKK